MLSPFKQIPLLSLLFADYLAPAPRPASIVDRAKYFFTFGDSYTWEGWSGAGDPLVPYLMLCTSAGPNWARHLNTMVGHTQLVNLAVSGAAADGSIVPSVPADFRIQAASFLSYVVPNRVPWTSDNSIFFITFGTNDVKNSYFNTIGNGTALYELDLNSYFATVDRLYTAGARHFVFNNAVPFDRAQIGVVVGPVFQAKLASSILEFNRLLALKARAYCASKRDINLRCLVFDTHTLFQALMDRYRSFGFVTPSEYCNSYALRTSCAIEPADPACLADVSAYVWKDTVHPAWRAHRMWAEDLLFELSMVF